MDGKTGVQFERSVSPLNAWAFSFACIIGWGAFVMPATFFLKKGGLQGSIQAFGASLLPMVAIAMNFHYLSSHSEGTGDFFSLVSSAVNKEYAFAAAWAISFAYLCAIPMNARALANLVRTLIETAFDIEFHVTIIDADHLLIDMALMALAFLVFGWINIRGTRSAGKVQTILALILFFGVALLCVLSFFYKVPGYQHRVIPSYVPGRNPITAFLSIFVMIPWAFIGFEALPMLSGELNFPVKRIGRIMVIAIFAGAFIYLACIFITLSGIPSGMSSWPSYLDHLGSQHGLTSFPVIAASRQMFGTFGLVVSLLAAFAAILTGLIGFTAIASRLFLSMARQRVLFPDLARLNPGTKTPANAIKFLILSSIIISILATSFTIMEEISSTCTACAYALCSGAALYRASKHNDRRFILSGSLGLFISVLWIVFLLIPMKGSNLAISGKATICLFIWIFFGIGAYTYSRVSPQLIEDESKPSERGK